MDRPVENTDTTLFVENPDDHYSPSLHKTRDGRISIEVGGYVFVKPLREWHSLAVKDEANRDVPRETKKGDGPWDALHRQLEEQNERIHTVSIPDLLHKEAEKYEAQGVMHARLGNTHLTHQKMDIARCFRTVASTLTGTNAG